MLISPKAGSDYLIAQFNATLCRALDYCDAMAPGPHLGAALLPAALAAAELVHGCSGDDLVAALAVGADEVAAALVAECARRGQAIELVRNGSRGLFWLEPLVEVETAKGRLGFGPVRASDVPSLLDAYLACAARARVTCTDEGYGIAGCDAQDAAVNRCIDTAPGPTPNPTPTPTPNDRCLPDSVIPADVAATLCTATPGMPVPHDCPGGDRETVGVDRWPERMPGPTTRARPTRVRPWERTGRPPAGTARRSKAHGRPSASQRH